MVCCLQDYLDSPERLSFEEMSRLHGDMIAEIAGDPEAAVFYENMIETATRYASFRANWLSWDREKKMDLDSSRTSCHDSLIVKLNILARYLRMQGKAAAWRDSLGDEQENPYARKRMGDFACYVVFINSLCAR